MTNAVALPDYYYKHLTTSRLCQTAQRCWSSRELARTSRGSCACAECRDAAKSRCVWRWGEADWIVRLLIVLIVETSLSPYVAPPWPSCSRERDHLLVGYAERLGA